MQSCKLKTLQPAEGEDIKLALKESFPLFFVAFTMPDWIAGWTPAVAGGEIKSTVEYSEKF